MNLEIILLAYAFVSLLTFSIFGLDKFKAVQNQWRISEKTLFFFSFIGPIGALLGMIIFHHKIRKIKFLVVIPLFLLLHMFITYLLTI